MNSNNALPPTTAILDKLGNGSLVATTTNTEPILDILQAVNDILSLIRVTQGKMNEDDINDIICNKESLVGGNNIERPVRNICLRY